MSDTIPRVVTLPVREIVDPAPENPAHVLEAFRAAWRFSTSLANWCQRELTLHDPGLRAVRAERLVRYEHKMFPGGLSLYQWVCGQYPDRPEFAGAAGSMGAVVKAVEDAWRSHPRFGRLSVLWRGESRPCVFQWPYPWPVRSQELKISRIDDRPHASITLPGGRVVVRVADDENFRRPLQQFDLLLEHPDRLRQAKITARRKGGRIIGADLRIVGQFDPRVLTAADDACACINTTSHALLVVDVEGRPDSFVYHGEELRQVIAVHDGWRLKLSVDMKHEKRWPSAKRRRVYGGEGVRARFDKAANRLRTARQQIAASVVAFLVRQRVKAVVYRDREKGFLQRFDWTGLREVLRHKCEEAGIAFQHERGGDDADE